MYRKLADKLVRTAICLAIYVTVAPTALAETREVVVGPEYERSGLHNVWWGKNYRELWTTPIQVEVLDLQTEAGGLEVVRKVGGKQTVGLALKGADGKSYTFRSVNKDLSKRLPLEWQQTIAARELQDQNSATHPGVFPFMNGLVEALPWAIEPPQRLVVMPDDPSLGQFRTQFAGRVGTFGEYPTPSSGSEPGFLGATEILSSRELWTRWLEGPETRIDTKLFLRYRIVDMWTGNADRHHKQWRWARMPGQKSWRPIAEDPDQVFTHYQGALLWLARWHHPRLFDFKDRISTMEGMGFNGADIDRWVLTDLDHSTFLQTAREIQAQLTDEVIDNAMKRMPPEWYAISGQAVAERLKQRRDNLEEGIDRYYRYLATDVNIHGTDRDEIVRISRLDDGAVEIAMSLQDDGAEPYYRRRFEANETQALHVYLHGGNDRVVSEGPAQGQIKVHVVGGPGDDTVDDSRSGKTRFYDFEGQNDVIAGKGTKLDTRPYENPAPRKNAPWVEPRDFGKWTRPEVALSINPDQGLVLGGGFTTTSWSFRKFPNDNRHRVLVRYSTGRSSGAFNYAGSFRKLNSKLSFGAKITASKIESLNFFGFGNETVNDDDLSARDFFEVEEDLLRFRPTINWRPSKRLETFFGPELQYTEESSTDTLIEETQPFGSGEFGQLGLILGFNWDSRGKPSSSLTSFELPGEGVKVRRRTGIQVEIEGSYFPELWDVDEDFYALQGQLTGNLGLGANENVVLAGRVGGRKVWKRFPWREAAFIGGQASNRGFSTQRFAGDSSLYGGVELRLHVFDALVVFPGQFWVYGLTDVGRVWSDEDIDDGDEWHLSYGGGVVMELSLTPIKFSAEFARNDDEGDLQFYLKSGYSF